MLGRTGPLAANTQKAPRAPVLPEQVVTPKGTDSDEDIDEDKLIQDMESAAFNLQAAFAACRTTLAATAPKPSTRSAAPSNNPMQAKPFQAWLKHAEQQHSMPCTQELITSCPENLSVTARQTSDASSECTIPSISSATSLYYTPASSLTSSFRSATNATGYVFAPSTYHIPQNISPRATTTNQLKPFSSEQIPQQQVSSAYSGPAPLSSPNPTIRTTPPHSSTGLALPTLHTPSQITSTSSPSPNHIGKLVPTSKHTGKLPDPTPILAHQPHLRTSTSATTTAHRPTPNPPQQPSTATSSSSGASRSSGGGGGGGSGGGTSHRSLVIMAPAAILPASVSEQLQTSPPTTTTDASSGSGSGSGSPSSMIQASSVSESSTGALQVSSSGGSKTDRGSSSGKGMSRLRRCSGAGAPPVQQGCDDVHADLVDGNG